MAKTKPLKSRKCRRRCTRKKKPVSIPLSDPEETWMVERIIDRRPGVTETWEYLLKWAGFGDEHNSWEPESNLMSPFLIQLAKIQFVDNNNPLPSPSTTSYTRTRVKMGSACRCDEEVTTDEVKVKVEKDVDTVLKQLDDDGKDFSSVSGCMPADDEEPEAVVNSVEFRETGQSYFGVKFKSSKMPTLVAAEEAKKKFPGLVFEYYEKQCGWTLKF